MSHFFHKFKRDIVGILYFASALFVGMALWSYRATDPSFNSLGGDQAIHNYCGYIGSFLSDIALQMWGLPAWFVFLALMRLARRAFQGLEVRAITSRLGWGLLLMVTVSSLLALYFPEKRIFDERVPLGGVIGALVTKGLIAAFNILGVSIILWAVALVLLVFYTEKSLVEIGRVPLQKWQAVRGLVSKINALVTALDSYFGLRKAQPAFGGAPGFDGPQALMASDAQRSAKSYSATDSEQKNNTTAVEPEIIETERLKKAGSFLGLFTGGQDLDENGQPQGKRRRVRLMTKVDRRVENWKLPEISLLEDPPLVRTGVDKLEIEVKAKMLTEKLAQFGVGGQVTAARPGPAVTMYEYKPEADVKISRITELADDLSLALSSESVRIIAPIPGRDVVGVETSNSTRETVYLKDVLAHDDFWSDKFSLPLALGRQANGDIKVVDLRKMPHLMVAGTTGSGKSVFVVAALTGLLFRHSPKSLRLILVDPKQVDLAAFSDVPHLLMPPIREPQKATVALKWAIREMDKRNRSMAKFRSRKLEEFNETVSKLSKDQIAEHEKVNEDLEAANHRTEQYYYSAQPYIVIVIEEFGDLMAVDKKGVENSVQRLTQMARACGIHLILAMQSPRREVVTGVIKTNIPGRISFKVTGTMESRIILDESGGERLLAHGDMLFLSPGVSKPQRHHGPWLSENEITGVMKFWSSQGEPAFDPLAMKALDGSGGGFDISGLGGDADPDQHELNFDNESDEENQEYDKVLSWLSSQKTVSASQLQTYFRFGFPKAARMIQRLESQGVIGPADGSKKRPVLISPFKG